MKAEESTISQVQPTKAASYALNLSHAYEVLYDFDGAFQVLLDFCQKVCVPLHHLTSHLTYPSNALTPTYTYIQHPKLRVGTKQGYLSNELYLAMTGNGQAKPLSTVPRPSEVGGVGASASKVLSKLPENQRETYAEHDLDLLAIGFAGNTPCITYFPHILLLHNLLSTPPLIP